ncbi:MAG: hypothetical protein EPGJADBJ_05420 [Saprospiraceae bacterium]|nr:hypothetical protein [Saprospiraceae bacterium]
MCTLSNANSKIIVNAPFKLTLQSDCRLEGCNGMWDGIILEPTIDFINPGGQLDMSNSRIEDAVTGVFAQHFSRVRFVSNVFADNTTGLKVTGHVPSINFGDPQDFKNNTFTAAWPNASTGIVFDNASYFYIGQDLSIPPAVVNTISGVIRGIDILNSVRIGIYGVTFTEMYESGPIDEPIYSYGLCIRNYNSRAVSIKYCTMLGLPSIPTFLQPNFGIATMLGQGRQVYHDNFIVCRIVGISAKYSPYAGTIFDIRNDSVIARRCIDMVGMSNDEGKNILINENALTYSLTQLPSNPAPFTLGGILTDNIGAPYQILDNRVRYNPTIAIPVPGTGIGLYGNTGVSEVSGNNVLFSGQYAGEGLSISSHNTRIYNNTLTGALTDNYPYRNTGILTRGAANLSFCCNTVDGSDLGTRFDASNSDIKFYTTDYGAHDTALYFPPAATLNAQINTGNTWAGASDLLDAFYDGSTQQAQFNAPFTTSPLNINSAKIEPNDWFFLFGTDPSCTESSFSCPDITPKGGITELTTSDLAALSAVGEENEYVLRFQQKRQLYRKLVENPSLVNWNQSVNNFYTAAQSNTVGAFDALDEAFHRLYSLSPSLEQTYNPLARQLDSLGAELDAIHAQYPLSTPEVQETLLEQAHELADQIVDLQNQVNALLPSVENEMQTRLTQLLIQNSDIEATEVWEINEKNINALYFRHHGGLIDTFTGEQKNFIRTLALSCPQYEGVGVYKARRLYELFAETTPVYHEHHCKPSEERSQTALTVGQLMVMPNPADEQILVQFGQLLPVGSKLVFSDVTGKAIFNREVGGMSEISLDVSGLHSGIYLIAIRPSGLVPLSIKAVISH